MVLDTGSPRSAISGRVRDALEERGLLVHTGRRYVLTRVYTLTGLTIEGQSVDDLDVYVSPRVNELDIQGVPVDGLIGLDFLARFRQINFDFDSMRLTLTR
jgi:hypothetical protein